MVARCSLYCNKGCRVLAFLDTNTKRPLYSKTHSPVCDWTRTYGLTYRNTYTPWHTHAPLFCTWINTRTLHKKSHTYHEIHLFTHTGTCTLHKKHIHAMTYMHTSLLTQYAYITYKHITPPLLRTIIYTLHKSLSFPIITLQSSWIYKATNIHKTKRKLVFIQEWK